MCALPLQRPQGSLNPYFFLQETCQSGVWCQNNLHTNLIYHIVLLSIGVMQVLYEDIQFAFSRSSCGESYGLFGFVIIVVITKFSVFCFRGFSRSIKGRGFLIIKGKMIKSFVISRRRKLNFCFFQRFQNVMRKKNIHRRMLFLSYI